MTVAGLVAGVLVAALPATAPAQPVPRPALSARIAAVETPIALDRTEVSTAVVDVRNTGSEAWPPAGDVRLSYHWTRADGTIVVGGGRRTHLPSAVSPGGSVRLCAVVEAPDEAGALRLEWDLVKEGVAWFSGRDPDSLLRQPVQVRDAIAAAPRGRPVLVGLWLLASLSHLVVSAAWACRRRGAAPPTVDARLFDTLLFAVGTLHGVLFVASATTGLAGARGAWWVAAFDALVALGIVALDRRGRAREPTAAETAPIAAPIPRTASGLVSIGLQIAGALALLTLAVSWVRMASAPWRWPRRRSAGLV